MHLIAVMEKNMLFGAISPCSYCKKVSHLRELRIWKGGLCEWLFGNNFLIHICIPPADDWIGLIFQLIGMEYYSLLIWAYAIEQNISINYFNSQKKYTPYKRDNVTYSNTATFLPKSKKSKSSITILAQFSC
jgi:hypothetical protein